MILSSNGRDNGRICPLINLEMHRLLASVRDSCLDQSMHDRGQSIKEVGRQIEGLQNLLRKMGDIVAQQGDLLNRIDENMRTGLSEVKKGKEQLQQRVGYETGED